MSIRILRSALLVLLTVLTGAGAQGLTITDAQAREAGQRLWQNECGGRVDGLTAWNAGENFASLGIGHFIWYPADRRGPFEESFPRLVEFLRQQNVTLPGWLKSDPACPWSTREAFLADFKGARLTELRALLASTVPQQARFAAMRLEAALPAMLESAPAAERAQLRARFENVAAAPRGIYALVDYVNFKGEGTKTTERYNGEGWGLLQVLQSMQGNPIGSAATREFSAAAARVLAARVANSPPARGESRWLPGWRSRVATYAAP